MSEIIALRDRLPTRRMTKPQATLACTRLATRPFLKSDELAALGDAALSRQPFAAGAHLTREGEPTGSIYFLSKGWACRYATTPDGRRQISAVLLPEDICNLDSLMTERLNYGVQMLTAGTVLSIPRDRALALAGIYPGIACGFTWFGIIENKVLTQNALCLGRQSARERTAHLFCELAVRLGFTGTEGAINFNFPLTQAQMADMLGMTAIHLNRTLGLLRAEGLLNLARKTVKFQTSRPCARSLRSIRIICTMTRNRSSPIAGANARDAGATTHHDGGGMKSGATRTGSYRRTMPHFDDLLLRETNHRCANDLQLVVSLLALHSRRATNPETQQSLRDAMERVSILARSRAALQHQAELSLEAALRQVCEALHSQAEPRSILMSLMVGQYHQGLSSPQIMTVALAVNELCTNAIKHAFAEDATADVSRLLCATMMTAKSSS